MVGIPPLDSVSWVLPDHDPLCSWLDCTPRRSVFSGSFQIKISQWSFRFVDFYNYACTLGREKEKEEKKRKPEKVRPKGT